MLRSVLVLTAVAVSLTVCGSAQAGKPGGPGHKSGHSNGHAHKQGQPKHSGSFYKGKHHKHWSHTHYSGHYKTTFYFNSGDRLWYYWCAQRDGFLPITYIESDPPTNDLGPNPDDDDD